MPRGGAGFSQALTHYREGRFEQSLNVLEELIAADPDAAVCHYLRGVVLKDFGRDQEAITAFDRAMALHPDLERVSYHRGTARFLAGDRQGALADLCRAVEEEPDFLFAVYNLGVAAACVRDWHRAKDAFARALDLDPGNASEYVDLLVEIGRASAQEEAYTQGHRLKNMIGVVGDDYRGLIADLERGARQADDAWAGRAARVEQELRHLYEDMVQFLRAVDQEPPEVVVIEVRELVERLLFALSPRLDGITVERRIADDLPDVIGDEHSLGEALMNVLINAVEACRKHREEGGRIEVEVVAVDAVAEIPGVDTVRLRVRDTGPGIPEQDIRRVFELGFTTKRFGSGLGLSSAERIIEAHGGRIQLRNREGAAHGAEVTVHIAASPVGAPNLRNLSLRSVLFEDLRALAIRGGVRDGLV
jgi:signal transduction histidine kinase